MSLAIACRGVGAGGWTPVDWTAKFALDASGVRSRLGYTRWVPRARCLTTIQFIVNARKSYQLILIQLTVFLLHKNKKQATALG